MGIIERAFTRDTRTQVIGTLRKMQVTLDAEATGRERPTIDRSTEYELCLQISVPFWANKAQFHSARDAALRQLANTLYEDALAEVHRLRVCIHSGDALGALECAGRIEKLSLATDREQRHD